MEQQRPTTPKRPLRPNFHRSQSASADLSPPRNALDRIATNSSILATRKLHIPLTHGADRAKKGGEKLAHAVADHSPVSAVTDRLKGHEQPQKRNASAPLPAEVAAPASESAAAPIQPLPRKVTIADVEKEKERRTRRNEELQRTLEGLSELARDGSQRIDVTFYSILQNAASLRSTITGLRELSDDSQQLLERFQADSGEVDKELGAQIAAINGFRDQRKQVTTLEERIQKSMSKTKGLSDRLEVARKRVELWEKRENEWQSRTSSRFSMR